MKLRILYHGNCFDGVSSAAVFTKFYRGTVDADAEITYTPTMHRANNAFDREQLDGLLNRTLASFNAMLRERQMGAILVPKL